MNAVYKLLKFTLLLTSQLYKSQKACHKCARYTKYKKKKEVISKVIPVHGMKAYRGRRGIAPLILNLGNRRR